MPAGKRYNGRNAARLRLQAEHDRLHSWAKVGALHGVSGALAWRFVVKGYVPANPLLRERLGISGECLESDDGKHRWQWTGSMWAPYECAECGEEMDKEEADARINAPVRRECDG